MTQLRRHLSYANVTATLALVVAVGGGGAAYAVAAKNSVNSASIVNGQVKRIDLAGNAVTGVKVADNTLTGADVKEGSLAKVPSAVKADSATTALTADSAAVADDALSAATTRNVLRALVTPEGSLAAGQSSGAVSAQKLGLDGYYEVIFDRDVSACTWLVGAAEGGQAIAPAQAHVTVTGRVAQANGVFVRAADASGAGADRGFSVVVVC